MHQTLRILHVENTTGQNKQIETELSRSGIGFEKKAVSCKEDFITQLKTFAPAVVFADYPNIAFHPHEALAIVQQMQPQTPFILIVEANLPDSAEMIIKEGMSGYVFKDRLQLLTGVLINATKENPRERKLRKSETIMAQAQQIAHFGSWELDLTDMDSLNRNPLQWSDEVFRIFGYEPGEIEVSNDNFFNAVHPDDRELIKAEVAKTLKEKSRYSVDHRILTPDGRVKWVNEYGSILLNEETGVPRKMVGVVHDITYRKQAELELKKVHERLTYHIHNSPLAVIEWNSDLKVSYWSMRAEEMFGWKKEEMLGRKISEINMVYKDDIELVKKVSSNLLSGKIDRYLNENRNYTRDGMTIYCEWYNSVLRDEEGNVSTILSLVHDVTTEVKAKNSLAKSEANLRNILENTNIAYVLVDTNANILSYNNVAARLAVISANTELKEGLNYIELMPEDRRTEVKKAIQTVLATGASLTYEAIYKYEQECPLFLEVKMYPIFNQNKEVSGLSIAASDITARKDSEELLKQSNERYELVTKATKDVIWDWDILSNKIYRTENYELISGYPVQEEHIYPESWIDNIHPDDKERIIHDTIEITEGKDAVLWEDEYRYLRYSGEYAYIADRGYIIRNEQGKAVRMVGAMRDISNQKRGEEDLKKSEANLRTIFNNTDIGYVLLDKMMKVVTFNQRAATGFKKVLGKILREGDAIADYFTRNEELLTEASYRKVLNGENTSYEKKVVGGNGALLWFMISLYPVLDAENNVLGLVIAIANITRQKTSEREREKMTHDLMKRNQDLEQFTYIVSHNLRAPLANIMGLASLYEDMNGEVQTDVIKEIMKGFNISARKLNGVINDLNDILAARQGVSENKTTVHFSELIEEVKSALHQTIGDKQIQFRTDFTDVDEFFGLKSYLYSIFYNLISNSIKYRQSNIPALIEIFSRRSGNRMQLYFRDNGMGINLTEKASHVFGLYKRFHHHIEGKGMGLFMVKTQVEMLGGRITVKSEVNKGTEFLIEFTL